MYALAAKMVSSVLLLVGTESFTYCSTFAAVTRAAATPH